MNASFSILPWEFRGSDHDPAPHAFGSVEFNGHRRECALKMRDGLIFFKDPKRAPMFAVTRKFSHALEGEELVDSWKSEVSASHYGRFITRHLWFGSIPASTVLAIVHRVDGSGWIKEWFDSQWLETPPHRDGTRLEMWGEARFHVANRRAIRRARPKMLDRILSSHDQAPDISQRWFRGSEEEARRIVPHFLRVFAPTMGRHFRRFEHIPMELVACSPEGNGGFRHYGVEGRYYHRFPWSSPGERAFALLQEHLAFEEMKWLNRHLLPDNSKHPYWKAEEIRVGNSRFGERWRGNFEMATGRVRFDILPFDIPTHHEKLESLLEVRDWLDGKVAPRKRDKLLAGALS